jgi:hypothetical protein
MRDGFSTAADLFQASCGQRDVAFTEEIATEMGDALILLIRI